MKIYKSKIGVGLVLFLVVVFAGASAILIVNNAWPGLLINFAIIVFITYMFSSTYYIIDGNHLIVRCGFMINMTIEIDTIKRIQETNNPLSSPATSLDRIAIYYDADSVMISPKDKMGFIKQLTDINSNIEVVFKKDKKLS